MSIENKLNILFVSIAFPPKMDPECLQTAKYFKYLVKDKSLNIDVVTSGENTLFMPIDENLRKYSSGYRQIIKVPFLENKYINFLMRKLNPSSLNYPDSKFRFYKKWKSVLNKLENKPEVIYSRSFPLSSTMMAYHLQKELQVPWVLHLSDPWTFGSVHSLGDATEWNENMEKTCFSQAAILSFTSLKTIDVYKKKYPEYSSKMMFFPNVFDLEDKKNIPYKLNNKIKVVYTGGLIKSNNRNPEYFFKAILELKRQYIEIYNDFEFIFAGALDRENKLLFEEFEKENTSVQHLGFLSFQEAISLQEKADLLLIIDIPNDSVFFPSKLLDYMLMQRRILAITKKNSTTWKIVNHKLGECFEHNDTENIVYALLRAWNAWKIQDKEYFLTKDIDMNFSVDFNTKKLSDLFHKLDIDNKSINGLKI